MGSRENIFSKKFWVKKIKGQKFSGCKNFGSNQIHLWVQRKMIIKKMGNIMWLGQFSTPGERSPINPNKRGERGQSSPSLRELIFLALDTQ